MYDLFNQYKTSCGWWNDNCSPGFVFGINEFLGLWILMEAGYDLEKAEKITETVAQNLYVGGNNPAYCSRSLCHNGVFNFIAAYGGRSGALFAGPDSEANQKIPLNHPLLGGGEGAREALTDLGNKALDTRTVLIWDINRGPSNWGNINGGETILFVLEITVSDFGLADDTIYYNVGSFVIYTLNQKQNLLSLNVDMSLVPVQ